MTKICRCQILAHYKSQLFKRKLIPEVMNKAKLREFKVSIRRQRKNDMFAQKRKEQECMARIEEITGQLFNMDLRKENFEPIIHQFKVINKCLVDFSKSSSKGSVLNAGKLLQNLPEIPFNPLQELIQKFSLLTSQKFKKLVLDLLEEVYEIKRTRKKFNSWHQFSQNLLFELIFMIGILFKEPQSLSILFPLDSIKLNTENRQINYEGQEVFEKSFELFQNSIKYLKQQFGTLEDQTEDKAILFLTIIHSIKRTLEFFLVNQEKTKRSTLRINSNPDEKKIFYLFSLLKSHNFQHYLKKILEQLLLSFEHNQDTVLVNEVPIELSIVSLIDMYYQFIDFGGFQIQSKLFIVEVKKFYRATLQQFSMECKEKSSNRAYFQNQESVSDFRSTDLRMLFELNSLALHSVLSFDEEDLVQLCYQMIRTLLISADRQYNAYESLARKQLVTNVQQFYLDVLIAQQGEKWMHFIQILTSLQLLVGKYDISLDQIMRYAINQDTQFGPKMVLKLFEDMSYCIINVSGYFYNERHLFAVSLANLFILWNHNSFEISGQMWSNDLFMGIAQTIYKLIDEIGMSIKENDEFDKWGKNQKDKGEIKDIQIDANQKNGSPVMQMLEGVRTLVELTAQKTINESNQDYDVQI